MKKVLALVLGGGAGTRLYPLTKVRAKPAVPLAGKYRLIDIPVSNCINSEIYKIYVLTQFNSASLNRHLSLTYRLGGFQQGFVEVLAAQQTPGDSQWFQGTADAVRQYLSLFKEWDIDEYLILSGDHLYRMDYRAYVEHHRQTEADITLSVVPVDEQLASAFGLMKITSAGRVVDFSEKPTGDALRQMRVDTTSLGLDPQQALQKPYIASMGIYVFKRQVLIDLLDRYADCTDFGKEIIPKAAPHYNLQAYLFQGYWEDIGTIKAFYEANLALTRQPNPPFSFYDPEAPIYTRGRYLPPSQMLDCQITESMLAEGCQLNRCRISRSVLGVRTRVEADTVIEDSLILGADYYQAPTPSVTSHQAAIGIGPGSVIRNAIIDKNAVIGARVQIVNQGEIQEAQREDQGFYIRDGIVVVLKHAHIPDGFVI
ncbi:MAG: glucose-1-phosphate adenylyltransferase [Cyanobacteria bacterium REEB459]|nr:glucose-1-phosphate adenylyltransferase [Cyanobacteria bacterium REEB459]